MIRNYIISALRNLWRNRIVTGINLAGMAIGFGLFLLFLGWTWSDLRFDRFHEDLDQMYILKVRLSMNGSDYDSDRTGGAFGQGVPERFPQVCSGCRVSDPMEFEFGVETGDGSDVPMRYFDEDQVLAVDSNFFDFFSFRLLEGDPDDVLSARNHLVVSESMARKLFGERKAVGESVRIGEGGLFEVAGVVEDPPYHSSYRFEALLNFQICEERGMPTEGFGGTMYHTNFRVREGSDIEELDRMINDWVEETRELDIDAYFYLDRFTRKYLYGESRGYIGVYLNLIMGFIILSIACINFINLTTAYSSRRIKEIAIRKRVGAARNQLIIQFMTESYILLLAALYLGLFLAEQLGPEITRTFGQEIDLEIPPIYFWPMVLLLYLVTGLLAGLYPATKIAGYSPVVFLSGPERKTGRSGSGLRRVLVITQFSFSILFILITIFSTRQFTYLKEADLGFHRENVLYIPTKGKVWERYEQIREELMKLHFVRAVSTASEVPVAISFGELDWGERENDHNQIAKVLWTDARFISTFNIGLQEGSYFREGRDSLNRNYVVVNRSLVDLMEWEDPVGRNFYFWGRNLEVLGVVDDFRSHPIQIGIFDNNAMFMLYSPVQELIFIRLNGHVTREEIGEIEEIFTTRNPGYTFEYDLLDQYTLPGMVSEEGIKLLFRIFSLVAIFIAVMGLVGLSIFHNGRRTKEIGIRKAMGAQTGSIVQWLLSDFLKLVFLSNLIALPAAYLTMRWILQFFSYSIELKFMVFLLVFVASILFSIATVSVHAIRTARANPVKSLRYE